MRTTLFGLLLLSASASAQQLHTFENGEVADAQKINENFNYVLENATGSSGCSAEQDGSSVVITCADGTSGVLASEGTVVVYPSGVEGESIDPSTFPSGDFVIKDANDVVLAATTDASGPDFNVTIDSSIRARLINDDEQGLVKLQPLNSVYIQVGYLSADCSGDPLALHSLSYLTYTDNLGFAIPGVSVGQQLIKSRQNFALWPNELAITGCTELSSIRTAWVLVPYQPATEILNAAYPIRVEQLP